MPSELEPMGAFAATRAKKAKTMGRSLVELPDGRICIVLKPLPDGTLTRVLDGFRKAVSRSGWDTLRRNTTGTKNVARKTATSTNKYSMARHDLVPSPRPLLGDLKFGILGSSELASPTSSRERAGCNGSATVLRLLRRLELAGANFGAWGVERQSAVELYLL